MSFRRVYGNDWSEAGWRMCNRDECVVAGPSMGVPFTDTAPIRRGDASTILVAWLVWYHRNVEKITSPVWGWSATNDVTTSNHLAGVALDIGAPKYPFGTKSTRSMPAARIAKIREGLRLFEGCVFWGDEWSYPDPMHYQLGYREGDARIAAFAKKLNNGHLGIYAPQKPTPPTRPEGSAMFTTAQVKYVLDGVKYLIDGVKYVAAQIGPKHQSWSSASSFGKNARGEELTMRDGLAQMKRDVEAIRADLAELRDRK